MIKSKNERKDTLIWLLPLFFLIGFYFYPMASILGKAFSPDAVTSWQYQINWNITKKAVGFTFYQAILSTLITMVLGIPLAYLFGRFRFRGRGLLRNLATVPFILPTVVVAAGFNALIGPRGWINLLLMDIFQLSTPPIVLLNSFPAILMAHVFYNTSIVIRVVGAAWERLDIKIENAAQMLGASPGKVFSKVTLPLILPSILSATVLVFLFDFTSFGVILLLGGARFSTIEVEIYIQAMQFLNLRMAGALSLIQLAFTMVFTFLSLRIGTGEYVPVTPISKGEGLKKPRTLLQKLFLGIAIFFLIAFLILPTISLLLRSLVSYQPPGSNTGAGGLNTTFDHFRGLFINERDSLFFVTPFTALINSTLYAVSASVIALLFGVLISIGSVKQNSPSRLIAALVMLPLGTSAVTLGLGYLSAFSSSPGSIQWYPVLIPIAHALIALPFVVRIIQPAIQTIPENLHEAAITLGVPKEKLWRRIDLPVIKNSLITASIYSFAISLGEFGATTFLARPEYPTLPVLIFRYLNLPGSANYGKAMAMAAVLLIICGCAFFLIERLQRIER